MQPVDTDILLSLCLLRLQQPSYSVNANNQAPGNFGVEGAAVFGVVHPEDPLDPWDHLVGGRVCRLVQADEP